MFRKEQEGLLQKQNGCGREVEAVEREDAAHAERAGEMLRAADEAPENGPASHPLEIASYIQSYHFLVERLCSHTARIQQARKFSYPS